MIDYLEEIKKYGLSLKTDREKEVAREAFQELLDNGFSYEFIYYAIERLNGRNIIKYRNLFFYKPFQDEVNDLIELESQKNTTTFYEKYRRLELFSKYGNEEHSEIRKEIRELLEEELTDEIEEILEEIYDDYLREIYE